MKRRELKEGEPVIANPKYFCPEEGESYHIGVVTKNNGAMVSMRLHDGSELTNGAAEHLFDYIDGLKRALEKVKIERDILIKALSGTGQVVAVSDKDIETLKDLMQRVQ